MIQANELRKENWVMWNDMPRQVGQLLVNGAILIGDVWQSERYWEKLSPIPLSPYILEAAGLKLEYGEWYVNTNTSLSITWDEQHGTRLQDEMYECTLPHIAHLHQLQNLYYALTQTELTINL